MEGVRGNHELVNGRLPGFYGRLGAGTDSESPADLQISQICDPDLDQYACCNHINDVICELDSAEKICAELIKQIQASEGLGTSVSAPEGPATSQSDLSQCSIENTALIVPLPVMETNTEKRKKREMNIYRVDGIDLIDLTSEDSCDSTISGKGDQEPSEIDQVQGRVIIDIAALQSPSPPSELQCLQSDPSPSVSQPQCQQSEPSPSPSQLQHHQSEPTVVDDNTPFVPYQRDEDEGKEKNEDALADVWLKMAQVLKAVGAQEPIPIPEAQAVKESPRVKRRKTDKGNAVVLYESSPDIPSIQLAKDGNELVQVEPLPPPRAKRARGRPRKDAGTSRVEFRNDKVTKYKAKGTEICVPGKGNEICLLGNQEDGEAQVGKLKLLQHEKEKKRGKKRRKGDKKGKRKALKEEESTEDDVDEEDEELSGKPEKSKKEEPDRIRNVFNSEKVEYEPYIRRNSKEVEDEDAELEDLFNDLKSVVASTAVHTTTPKAGPETKGACEHKNFDFDEDVGYYCEDCGSVGIDMPSDKTETKSSGCAHKNYEFADDVGYYCVDCGLVGKDIQKVFLFSEAQKALKKKQVSKVQEAGDKIQQFRLTPFTEDREDFSGADLQLHPLFEQRLHPHQKRGFKFLTENLLGGPEGRHESVGCVLAHAPGTGKTFLMTSFIQSFLSRFPEGRPLILAPKIMLTSWYNEFKKFQVQEVPIYGISGRIRGNVADGAFEEDEEEIARLPVHSTQRETRAKALQEWQAGRGVLLMSYHLFSILVSKGVDKDGKVVYSDSYEAQMAKILLESPNLVVLDEGHLARNNKTKISQALMNMTTKRRVLLSGTLFQNNFKELYTLLKLCRVDFMSSLPRYGKLIAEYAASQHSAREMILFEEKMFTEEIGYKLETYAKSGDVSTEEIQAVVKKLQFLTASFVDWYPGDILKTLPGLTEYSIHLNLTDSQQQLIARLPTSTNEQRQHHMTRQCKILAACIHPSLVHKVEDANNNFTPFSDTNGNAPSPPATEMEARKGVKVSFLLQLSDLCKAAKEKLLIFCSTLTPLSYIEDVFSEKYTWKKGTDMLRLDGTMTDSDRQRVIDKFNCKGYQTKALMASTKACKEGITLVGASRVVILDNQDNPSVVRQAVSRAFRIGQERKVFVYRLVAVNHDEEEIFSRSVNKERLSQVLLDPVSTMARMGTFLQEQSLVDMEDEFLQKLMQKDICKCINVINKYNASG